MKRMEDYMLSASGTPNNWFNFDMVYVEYKKLWDSATFPSKDLYNFEKVITVILVICSG